ncbi:RNA polymerase III subunit RPC82 helix-turn-helix domain-containing protein [Pterulicium gracile]|uniref:DNA-directed RNA polymerase III subunit RPC3 n=1 Tax=Pterulicium gracile TaxID=1884261 RepID=A0A5C3QZM0_9AGAR|nr:RNA polymerase III subunit RPC82 helix-turn-helix domain-containing protein [Pterula gracilis]
MPDVHTSRLCTQIIYAHFGPLTAKVVSALLTRGRLTLSQLIRYTGVRPRPVRASLLILIQHNLVYHDLSEGEGEVFEVNIEQCLIRLRFGKFVWHAGNIFGEAAAEIVQLILDHGKLQVPDIITQLSAGEPKRIKLLTHAMHQLVSNAFLRPSTILSHISPEDKLLKYEAEETAKISGLPTAKQLRESKEIAIARLRREEGEEDSVGMLEASTKGAKSSKTKSQQEVNPEVYFRVNYDRFHLLLRNELVESLARERFNDSVATLVHATLKAIEEKGMKLSDVRSMPTSIANICMQLTDDDDLSVGLFTNSTKKIPQAVLAKEYIGMLSSADNPTSEGKEASFVTLSSSKVYVEFEIICRRLRRRVLEAMVGEWHGQNGVRLVSLLLSTGKLEEKQISKLALMAMKDVRSLLSAMSNDGLVSIQEVPKTADRAPSRTFYLWYVDLDKAYSAVLSRLYKTLYNISVRYSAELQEPELKAVLEKRQRTDISSDESLLTRIERETIQKWDDKRDRLTVLQARVDETVFILRELAVFGTHD